MVFVNHRTTVYLVVVLRSQIAVHAVSREGYVPQEQAVSRQNGVLCGSGQEQGPNHGPGVSIGGGFESIGGGFESLL